MTSEQYENAPARRMADLSEIIEFIISTCEDPQRAAQYRSDPEAFLETMDLSPEAKDVILGRVAHAVTHRGTTVIPIIVVIIIIL